MSYPTGTVPGMTSNSYHATVERLWAAAEARDWAAYADCFAEDFVCEMPQTRERVFGRDRWVRFNSEYPGDWHVDVQRIVADDDGAVSWAHVHIGDHLETGISFFTFDDAGRVATLKDFWPEPYEPPAGREHLVERY